MHAQTLAAAAVATLVSATMLAAQVQAPPAPWRGAGPTPCVGPEGGIYQCPPAPEVIVVRAGRLFDSRTGQLSKAQVVCEFCREKYRFSREEIAEILKSGH